LLTDPYTGDVRGRPLLFRRVRPGRCPQPADALIRVTPLELLLFGALCYALGLVSGAVVIPWLVDRGLFRGRTPHP
jgi:hypothetical protein